MRITLESDYALRILSTLAKHNDITDAKTLSDETSVSPRFSLKILHKLVKGNLVRSFKGANGGYKLNRASDSITLKEVIELIDGPIAMVRCVGMGETCSLNQNKTECVYHHIFDEISFEVAIKLSKITIQDVLNKTLNHKNTEE